MSDLSARAESEPRRRIRNPVPREGDGGFSQTWYPICLSADVGSGAVLRRDFLDGQVVVVRGASGGASVMSAYCPHFGADLSLGAMVDGALRCAFHHFEFGADGRCLRTGSGDAVPRYADLFAFPTVERYGIVWAFNGERAAWELPGFAIAEESLVLRHYPVMTLPCDPWMVIANTADFQHFRFLHDFEIDFESVGQSFRWHPNGLSMELPAVLPGRHVAGSVVYRITHVGTNLTTVDATIDGQNAYVMIGFGIPRPGETEIFTIVAAPSAGADGAAENALSAGGVLDQVEAVFGLMGSEDNPVLATAHVMPGAFTATDRHLIHFLQYVRTYPRAHPSQDFIQ